MDLQVQLGDQVGYFFAGRCYPFTRDSYLRRWKRGEILYFEVVNPPIQHCGDQGTFPPEFELGEPLTEKLFRKAVDAFRPDIIHIQELSGLPFTIIDIIRDELFLPVVMTLHNYFLLCPTLNFFTPKESFCKFLEDDPDCAGCISAGFNSDQLILRTLGFENRKLLLQMWVVWQRIMNLFGKQFHPPLSRDALESVFARRRNENTERLRSIELLIAQSYRTREIYAEYTGRKDIVVLHSSAAHISKLYPRKMYPSEKKIRFVTLNGCASVFKGARVLLEALVLLQERGLGDRFMLDVWGGVHECVYRELISLPMVVYHGFYRLEQLDDILQVPDVGIIPSICEEVYGYVGIEFLAKGIPVIGNKRGGIPDYVWDGKSGWLNESCTSKELAEIMEAIIREPLNILPFNRWIVENRSLLITDMMSHANELSMLYDHAISIKGR